MVLRWHRVPMRPLTRVRACFFLRLKVLFVRLTIVDTIFCALNGGQWSRLDYILTRQVDHCLVCKVTAHPVSRRDESNHSMV